MKGNMLDDNFIFQVSKALTENMTLKALNISENRITDTGASEIFRLLPLNISIEYISIKRNLINGESLPNFAALLTYN
jgi:hypothetical protein